MAISASADFHAALVSLWDSSGLDAEFTDLWAVADRTNFMELNDGEAAPGTPSPYCVFEILTGTTTGRDSGHSTSEKHEHRNVPFQFRVHTLPIVGGRTAKRLAADLIDEIMQIYGGHPTVAPTAMSLGANQGGVANVQYQTDYGIRTGDSEHQWNLDYLAKLDVPLAL